MSTENAKKFFDLVATDEALRTQIDELLRRELGESRDEQRMLQVMENHVLPLARHRGLEFTMEQMSAHMRRPESTDKCQVDDEELEAVVGGLSCTHWVLKGSAAEGYAWVYTEDVPQEFSLEF